MDWETFVALERQSRDVLMVRKSLVRMTSDLAAGVMLSQIIYWHLPNQDGQSKLRVQHNGEEWLVKSYADWWDECCLTQDQARRCVATLRGFGLIETKTMRFAGAPTIHIRLVKDAFLRQWESVLGCSPYRNGPEPIWKWAVAHIEMGQSPDHIQETTTGDYNKKNISCAKGAISEERAARFIEGFCRTYPIHGKGKIKPTPGVVKPYVTGIRPKLSLAELDDVSRAAVIYSKAMAGNDPQFVMHAKTFLNGRWREYVPEAVAAAADQEKVDKAQSIRPKYGTDD